ncbi:hypothetical protein FF38_02959 [Lucilia cuprina]|uniref:Uncharacterized protein n=1 Tax=Lucilia cuprina TaxID=7375 RepID=A0A0L0CQ30_LUCCU|nr:hypothetical protein FF38_02959 [Lucilia cuprina]
MSGSVYRKNANSGKMEQLRKKRTQLKKSVIKLYNFISGHNVSYNDIKVRMEEFENVFMKYKDVQDEIDSLCDKDSDIQKEDAYRNEIDEMYFTAKSIYTSYTQENLDSTVIEGAAASTPQLNNDLTALLQTMSTTLTSVVNLQSSGMNNSNINNNNSREKVSHPSGSPTALSTIFGWVIMGNVNRQP